ncbi:hypothetical protein QFZ28_001154 [Neobacillus niacini]|uniref:hypothetical protein n=1 Tax=Neobacillus niacini TaxID=86668 RepID=UPI0027840CC9|nr:hypothetical protein [Neobacillus niacini]MDQ1000754.1 hypothetical protein [Neobacillus niacini]
MQFDQLTLDGDVSEEVIRPKVTTLDILGEVKVREKKIKGVLQNVTRVSTGSIKVEGKKEADTSLHNVGELSH